MLATTTITITEHKTWKSVKSDSYLFIKYIIAYKSDINIGSGIPLNGAIHWVVGEFRHLIW